MQKGKEAPIASHSPKAKKIEGVGWRKESEHALLPSLCKHPCPVPATPPANTPANTPCNTLATPPFIIEINKQEI